MINLSYNQGLPNPQVEMQLVLGTQATLCATNGISRGVHMRFKLKQHVRNGKAKYIHKIYSFIFCLNLY